MSSEMVQELLIVRLDMQAISFRLRYCAAGACKRERSQSLPKNTQTRDAVIAPNATFTRSV